MRNVQGLLRRAARGINLTGVRATITRRELEGLLKLSGFYRVISFLTLLHELATATDY